jgi:hypothetical protein
MPGLNTILPEVSYGSESGILRLDGSGIEVCTGAFRVKTGRSG